MEPWLPVTIALAPDEIHAFTTGFHVAAYQQPIFARHDIQLGQEVWDRLAVASHHVDISNPATTLGFLANSFARRMVLTTTI